jgi:hypothetical protein
MRDVVMALKYPVPCAGAVLLAAGPVFSC